MSFISHKERTKFSAPKFLPGKNEVEQCCATSGYNHVSSSMAHFEFVHQPRAPLPQCSSHFLQFFAHLPVCEVWETPSKCRISWVCHFTVQYKSLTAAKRKCRAKPFTKDCRFLGAIVESLFCHLGILLIILKSLMLNIRSYSMTIWLYDCISRFYTRKIGYPDVSIVQLSRTAVSMKTYVY